MFPKRLNRTVIYESQWINLYIDKVLMPSGKVIEKYHQLDYPNEGVTVLLLNENHEVCFIKSLRYTANKIAWELPSGNLEKGEQILAAAEREVVEETGLKPKALKHIYSYHPSNGMSNQTIHIASGKVSAMPQTNFDTDEVQEVHWLSQKEIQTLIDNNEIMDGVSLIPLLFYFSGMVSHKNIT